MADRNSTRTNWQFIPFHALVILFFLLSYCPDVPAQGRDEKQSAKVDRLIRQLGNPSFTIREQASKELIELGWSARPSLRDAEKANPDPEVRRRATLILQAIERSAEMHVIGVSDAGPHLIEGKEIDALRFCLKLRGQGTLPGLSPARRIWELLPKAIRGMDEERITKMLRGKEDYEYRIWHELREALNQVLKQRDFYDPKYFAGVPLNDEATKLLKRRKELFPLEVQRLNRLLLEASFPNEVQRNQRGAYPPGVVPVQVMKMDKPVILVLCADKSVRWQVSVADGVPIAKVILGGYCWQDVTGVDAPVVRCTHERENFQTSDDYFFAYTKNSDPRHMEQYLDMVKKLRFMTGREITTFQGQYRFDGRPFVIGPMPPPRERPKDAELHVVGLSQPKETSFFTAEDEFADLRGLCTKVFQQGNKAGPSPGKRVWQFLYPTAQAILEDQRQTRKMTELDHERNARARLVFQSLNEVLRCPAFYKEEHFEKVALSDEVKKLLKRQRDLSRLEVRRLNRLLIEASFPQEVKQSPPAESLPETVTVKVTHTGKPIILVLTAGCPIRWNVQAEKDVKIHQVIVGGWEFHEVTGTGAPVLHCTIKDGDRTDGNTVAFYASQKLVERTFDDSQKGLGPGVSRSYRSMENALRALTGLEITSFQGAPRYKGAPLVVGPKQRKERE